MQKFIDMISIQLQSKRTWASITSFVTLIGTIWFPDKLPQAIGIVVILQSWALGDAVRPAVSKWLAKPEAEKKFDVPEEVLAAVRQTMIEHAMGAVSTYNQPVVIEVPKNDVH